MDEDLALERRLELGPFYECKTLAETLVLANALIGIDSIDELLCDGECGRESLVEAADEIERVGLTDLARLIRRHARKAKPLRRTTTDRWRTSSAEAWLQRRRQRNS
jgi:hypothetical protein